MKERRKHPRYQVALRVRYETKKAFQNAVTQNISFGGLYVATETPFDVGHQFGIEIDLPKKKEWIKGTCEVMWVNRTETKHYPEWIHNAQILKDIAPQQLYKGMGVSFVQMLPKYRKRMEEYLGEIAKEAKPS
jgi:Tfp pilus assembly protein PilZ